MLLYVDEVATGAISGPVLVCCVAVEPGTPKILGVKDSKQLSRKKREELYPKLLTLEHAFGSVSPKTIETLNIHYAKYHAMKIAVDKLAFRGIKIDKVIVDGKFPIPNLNFPQEPIVKADDKFWECGAASILAKVKRDNLMTELSKIEKYSHFDWGSNVGYYAPSHREGIILYGPTTLHRVNFGYFQYCMKCREEYLQFLKESKTYEDYVKYREQNKNHYVDWRDRNKNIKFGEIEWK